MATKNVNSFLPTGFIDLNTSDSLLGIVNGDLKRLNAGSISILNLTSKTGYFINTGAFSYTGFNNNPISLFGSGNYYIQQNIQNFATGTSASSDLVLTSNAGTDINNYIDLGINNVGYSDPAFTINSGNDAHLYNNGGNLSIGTQTLGKTIKFHAGGTKLENQTIEINSSGLTVGTGCNIYGTNTYQRLNADFGPTVALPSIQLSFNLEGGKVYEMDQFFRFTTSTANSSSTITVSPASSIFADGYKMGINNISTFGAASMIFVADNNNATVGQGMLGDILAVAHHFRKGILRPNQNATINFLAGSANGLSTTLGLGSYVIIKKLT